jgi:hypothetical protein
VDTPTKRRLVFTGIAAGLALLTFVAFRISFEVYSSTSCVTKSCFNSLHHNWYWWRIAGDASRVTIVSGLVGLVLGNIRHLRIIDDIVERYPWKNLAKLRTRLNTWVMLTRRVSTVITFTSFIGAFVALMILVEIAQH